MDIDRLTSHHKSHRCTEFLQDNNLFAANMSTDRLGPNYTFIPTQTMIDHVIADTSLLSQF